MLQKTSFPHLSRNYEEFERTARFWTESYANPSSGDEQVHRLVEMGFSEEQVREALIASGGDENAALEALLSSV